MTTAQALDLSAAHWLLHAGNRIGATIILHALKVLIVDDNVPMRTLLVAMLRGFGLRDIGEAADGEHAFRELRTKPYDIVITDLAMPSSSGIELCHALRRSPKSPAPQIPIILVTAHTERDRVLAARDAGVNEVVTKPLSARTLVERLCAVIDEPRAFVQSAAYVGPCRRRRADPNYRGPKRRRNETDFRDTDWVVELD